MMLNLHCPQGLGRRGVRGLFPQAVSNVGLQLKGMPTHTHAGVTRVQCSLALLPARLKGPPYE